MMPPDPLASVSREERRALVAELQRQNAARQRQVAEVTASHEALPAEIEPLTRGGQRPAAPCSKGTREPAPKRPGRKPGAGMFRSREASPPEAITEPPVDDDGGMVTDRGRSDDARAFEGVAHQQCLAHRLRSVDDVLATKKGRAHDVGEPRKGLLQAALALWRTHRNRQVAAFKTDADALQAEATSPLRDRGLRDADHQRLLNARGWHHDRGHVRRFLADPRRAPTNHRGRGGRP